MSKHRDAVLLDDVREEIAVHCGPTITDLSFAVHGGVVHVDGQLAGWRELTELRRILARLRGVHAVWDLVQVRGEAPLQIIDIGCGASKQTPRAIGIDRHAHAGVDIVADLERGLPLADGSIDHAFAIHFLEHVHELLPLLNEVHRVLRPQGVLHVMVPHQQCVNAWADPTHVRCFHPQTFKYLCSPRPGLRPYYPLIVSAADDNIFADLQPVGANRAVASEEELARFFN